jgi:hypothetical protein
VPENNYVPLLAYQMAFGCRDHFTIAHFNLDVDVALTYYTNGPFFS